MIPRPGAGETDLWATLGMEGDRETDPVDLRDPPQGKAVHQWCGLVVGEVIYHTVETPCYTVKVLHWMCYFSKSTKVACWCRPNIAKVYCKSTKSKRMAHYCVHGVNIAAGKGGCLFSFIYIGPILCISLHTAGSLWISSFSRWLSIFIFIFASEM